MQKFAHCGRDLPETPPPETPPTQDRRKQQPMGIWGLVWVICLVLVALLLAIFWRPTHDSKTPEFVTIRQSISLGADMVPAGARVN